MTLSALSRRAPAPGAAAALTLTALPALADTTLLNVSYDPTRKLYQAFNTAFAKQWKAKSGVEVFTPNPKTSGGARGCSRPTPPASRCGHYLRGYAYRFPEECSPALTQAVVKGALAAE